MSDLLPLLDELDRLHGAATPEPWWRDRDSIEANTGGVFSGWSFDGDADLTIALYNAYPRLSAALRAVLTPVMEGEREAREALAAHDERMKDQWSWKRAENPDVEIHLRTALNLLTAEHAKAADYQQEVARLRAALDAERAKGRA